MTQFRQLASSAVAAVIFIACSSEPGERSISSVTPSGTPMATATATYVRGPISEPTNTPIQTPSPARNLSQLPDVDIPGTFIGQTGYGPGQGLRVASKSDPTRTRAIADGSRNSGYAGVVEVPNPSGGAKKVLYYIDHPNYTQQGEFRAVTTTLYRVDLAGGTPESLFSFAARGDEHSCCNASVSPDGRYVVYAHVAGLRMLDLKTWVDIEIERNKTGCSGATGGCFGNYFPRWTADGRRISFYRLFWEEGAGFTIDPFVADPATTELLDPSASFNRPPTGACLLGDPRVSGRTAVLVQPGRADVDLRPVSIPAGAFSHADSCAVSNRGEIAVSFRYLGAGSRDDLDEIIYFDSKGQITSSVRIDGEVAQWMPDGEAVLVVSSTDRLVALVARNRPVGIVASGIGRLLAYIPD